MKASRRKIALIVASILLASSLSGCSKPDQDTTVAVPTAASTVIPVTAQVEIPADVVPATAPVAAADMLITAGLDEMQLNSINMLNYLVVLTQEINASKNSRLYLEGAYSSLLNNTSPEAVDTRTLVEINYLLDTLESYRMINVKRDRLEYIYEQNKAQALRDAVPSPLGLMSAVQSFSLNKLIGSVVYMAVDSFTSYESSSAQADLQYLQDGWALDDEEATTLHEIRKGTFNYMVETVRDYKLPGSLALTEKAVADYVNWKNKTNNLQIIQFFEENVDVYRGFGPYWLTLAECYYKNGDYRKCLEAIATYQSMQTGIFRRDYSYARVLPLGIVAAQQVYDQSQYVEIAEAYVKDILSNTDNNEWTLRYFAAQTYIELYGMTSEKAYLENAYSIALNNVNYLIDEQKNLNAVYLADVQEVKEPEGATKTEKKEIKQYNKLLKEERKTALPPIHEPLLLNCELLFALADELDISAAEAARIDGILHENGAAIFLIDPLDRQYRLSDMPEENNYGESVSFDGSKITIPARLVSDSAEIVLTVFTDGEETVFGDWAINKVERRTNGDLSTFTAAYTSTSIKEFDFKVGAQVHISVVPKAGSSATSIDCDFVVVAAKKLYVINSVDFQRVVE